MDDVFRALSNPTRREILRLLRAGDQAAGDIGERFPVALSTLSGHLRLLREAGLVVTERHGTTIVYSLNVSVYEETVAAILDLLGVGGERAPERAEGGRDAYQRAE